MLRSMTGYGSASSKGPEKNIQVEIKTLNSKFLDIYCRIPKAYSHFEIEIRKRLTAALERGKVEMNLSISEEVAPKEARLLNREMVKAYFDDLESATTALGIRPEPNELLKIVLQFPQVLQTEQADETEKEDMWPLIESALEGALVKCDEFRLQEGAQTEKVLIEYASLIQKFLAEIEEADHARLPAARARLEKNVRELISEDTFDSNRFEQELIYYFEKLDISEEKNRLKNHLSYFEETLNTAAGHGKKLNFIAQEIGREINTIGSKANDAPIQRLVVQMKDELEKIKEQTLNIL